MVELAAIVRMGVSTLHHQPSDDLKIGWSLRELSATGSCNSLVVLTFTKYLVQQVDPTEGARKILRPRFAMPRLSGDSFASSFLPVGSEL